MENQGNPNSKYQNGKIYKLIDVGYNDIYIGSTVQNLYGRMGGHRSDYRKWKSGVRRSMCSSFILFEKHGVDNCKIELVELFPCSCVEELRAREGYHQQQHDCVNKKSAGRTRKQYRLDNIARKREYDKSYCQANKEKRQNHDKEYRALHKDRINALRGERLPCAICGLLVRRDKMREHTMKKHPAEDKS